MAVVLGAFVPDTAARWRSVAKGEVARELGVAAVASKLAARLERVAAAVDDAEARAARRDDDASEWLATVRATVYESDGAVDRFKVAGRRYRDREPQQQQQALPWLLSSCCENDAEPRREVAAEIKNASKKLKAVLKEQRRLQLKASSAADRTVQTRTVLRRRNHHGIVGKRIEDDTRQLVDRLTQTQGRAACEVVAIIGPDGIGKTTLAKAVYDSARVRCIFEIRSWVRLRRGYTEAGLLSQVVDAVGGDTAGDESVADLEAMLAGLVANKRFLLVVDDVWYGGQCFLYCSLFPPGFAVDRRALVQQWVAERFVQTRVGATVEEVAEEYYHELVGRNLLQTTEEDAHSGGTERCTMHEMLHALAQLLLQGEGFTGNAQRPLDDGDGSFALRRVSLPGRNMAAVSDWVLSSDRIRTLLLPKNPLATAGKIFERMHHLRVLDLSETGLELVPETLGNLVHLRFLNLSGTRIHAVPESIGNLTSLKFLLLRECKSLHALPKSIEHLRGLRDLDLAGTVINAGAFRVGELRSLKSLRYFGVTSTEARATQDRGEWPLAELKHLYQLRTLHVQKLEKAASPAEAAEAALAVKTSLRELALSCSGNVNLFQAPAEVRKIEAVFQEMNPPECLESLKISNYFGAKFPTWLSAILLPNLRRLDIIGCNLPLPPLGQLPELRSLHVADSSALKFIDAEFMGCNHHQVPFPKLENLHLQGLHKLQRWMEIEAEALPCLQAMQLESCPELRRLPGGLRHVTSLMELRIVDMASIKAVEGIAALRELSVWNTPNLKKISSMPSLEDLSISHCPMLQIVENVDRLQAVHIFDHQLQEIPRWIKPLAGKLQSLDVTSTIKVLKRCLVDGPDWPLIKDIVQVHGLTIGPGYVYYAKNPYIFESNVNSQSKLSMERKTVDSDNADDASAGNTNVNQDDLVSASSTGYQEISGFFDSKPVKKEAIRTEDNVNRRDTHRSVQRNSQRRMHKLAEIIPEDGEAEEDAHSVVILPAHPTKAHAQVEKLHVVVTDNRSEDSDMGLSKFTPHETGPDAITSVLTRRRRSEMGKDVPTDAGTSGGTSVNKSAAAAGHSLAHEGSRAINSTEIDQNLNVSSLRSKECTLNKGDNFANISRQARRVDDSGSKVQTQVVNRDTKELGDDRTENVSPAIMAHSRKVTFNIGNDDHMDATIYSPNTANQNAGKINEIATAGTNAATMPDIPPDGEVAQESAATIDSSLTLKGHHTASITKASPDFRLLCDEQRLSSEGKEVPNTAKGPTSSAVDSIGGHIEGKSTSLPANPITNHEESKATSVTETRCDSEPCRLPASLAWRKQRAVKKQEASFADPGNGIGASIKTIPGMARKTLDKCKVGSVEHPSTEVSANTNPEWKPAFTPSCTTEATMAIRHHANRHTNDSAHCSIDVKAEDPHEAPKVYTAIWADTDTDTLRARFLSSMQYYRKMASRRRRRHRTKRGSGSKWSIGPVLVVVLLVVSMAQLLFIVWLYRRLLNQK
nr:putative disease resistance protein RGA3 [Lolium perenne]